jgi:hypothetical protein
VRRPLVVTIILVAAVALLVGLFFAFRGGSDSESGKSSTLEISVVDGKPDGGVQHLTVDQGASVTVQVTSDGVEDEVHVHGYDLSEDVAPGAPAEITFTADIAGRFEIELEDAGTPIGELEVR